MNKTHTISLFIPCIVDQVYPEIGLAMAKVLKHFGYRLNYDSRQTCCGQPAFNAGHRNEAKQIAAGFIRVFEQADCIVGPSGSCIAMIKNYYPLLFKNGPLYKPACDIGKRVYEFSQFLSIENLIAQINGQYSGKVGFHNSCHSLRELGVDQEPFQILHHIKGIELIQPNGDPVCCGFGGLFSVKFEEIAATMAKTRLRMFTDLGVRTLISNDPGCIMHMRQEALDRGININILHLTEFLVKAMDL